MEWIKDIKINFPFAKWFQDNWGSINLNESYWNIAKNCRVNNSSTYRRRWIDLVKNFWTSNFIRKLWTRVWRWLSVVWTDIQKSDTNLWTWASIWTINWWTSVRPSIITYFNLSLFFNWDNPQLYDWTTLTNLDLTIPDDWKWPSWPNIAEYHSSAWNTIVWFNNVVYFSVPADVTTPENIYDFAWLWASAEVFKDDIVWIRSVLENLYIFTETEIHRFANQLWWIDWTQRIITKVYDWSPLAWKDAVTFAWRKTFFLTKDKSIKTIWFIEWVDFPQVWELSNLEGNSVQNWLLTNLDDDQSDAIMTYQSNDNLIKLFCKWVWSSYNNLCLVYDLANKTWFEDTWKSVSDAIEINWKYYISTSDNDSIYQDEIWVNDDWVPIEFVRETVDLDFWNVWIKKKIRYMLVSWQIDLDTTLKLELLKEWEVVKEFFIDKNVLTWYTDNRLYYFRKLFSKWKLYEKWYVYNLRVSCSSLRWEFSLNWLTFWVWSVWRWNQVQLFEK